MLNPAVVAARTDAPSEDHEPVFKTPWEARIFAMTAQLADSNQVEWDDFKNHLIDSVAYRDEFEDACDDALGTAYYRAWLRATEKLLSDYQMCSPKELDARIHLLQHPEAAGKQSPTGTTARPVAED